MMELVSDERLSLPSASGMDRIFQCEGSWIAEQVASQQAVTVPDGGKDAQRGTLIHKAVETGDATELDDADASVAVEVRATEERLVTEWLAETGHTLADATIWRECRLWVEGLFSAQLDTLVVNNANRTGFVMDIKAGRKKVAPPVRNYQLRAQALAAYVNHGVFPIRTAILQPLAQKHPICEYSEANLNVLMEVFWFKLGHVRAPGLPRTAGPACEFCRARHVCPEAKRSMSVVIGAQSLNWNLVTPDEKLRLWKAAVMAEDCAGLIKAQIKADLAADPSSIPGLVQAKPQHPIRITDVPKLFSQLLWEVYGPAWQEDSNRLALAMEFISVVKISKSAALEFFESKIPNATVKDAARFLADRCRDSITEGFRAGKIDVLDPEPNLSLANRASGEPTTP